MDLSRVSIHDLVYTLSERRTNFQERGFVIAGANTLGHDVCPEKLRTSSKGVELDLAESHVVFVVTGQGARSPAMAKELLHFSTFHRTIRQLDKTLSSLADGAPEWALYDVLSSSDDTERWPIQRAEFVQPLTTAIQIGLINLLREFAVSPQATVCHSSGEIAMAYAAGLISAQEAIIIGELDVQTPLSNLGMDSVPVAELRQFLYGATGAYVPFLTLMNRMTSVVVLAATVVEQMSA